MRDLQYRLNTVCVYANEPVKAFHRKANYPPVIGANYIIRLVFALTGIDKI
jgi:hypothetical protein